MKRNKIDKENVIIELSKDELMIICNALNEVCHGIKVLDFEKKIGTNREKAKIILRAASSVFDKAPKDQYD